MYSKIINTSLGQMSVPINDINQTGALLSTGRPYDYVYTMGTKKYVSARFRDKGPGLIVDAGACLGTWSLTMRDIPGAVIHAFEAQSFLAGLLNETLELNHIDNITVHNKAVGNLNIVMETRVFDYGVRTQFGSIELGLVNKERLSQDPKETELIEVVTLDSMFKDSELPIHFMKIDVEGMEDGVIEGAQEIINKHHPILFVEHLKHGGERKQKLKTQLIQLGYMVRHYQTDFFCL